MSSLFSTSSDTSGYRLQYMEIYNWGTFHNKIFRMEPTGNNALLTGANASGKSTIIDALLTLMVPAQKDRFYNQSSGVEKKGNRTEETYVLGNYGNIQREGDNGATTQSLRDKSTYSVLLATFCNNDMYTVTLFQVRWFSSGELRRSFGVAHCGLSIDHDFRPFDGKGVWRKRLEKTYRTPTRNLVEFFDGPVGYADRLTQLFGMKSKKALSLFNQIVGVKVLDDLDEFIRTNMLEEQNGESQYIQLKESFKTLIEAKNNIEKAKLQIEQLTPIADLGNRIMEAGGQLKQLTTDRETVDYWFARKTIELGKERIEVYNEKLKQLKKEEERLRKEENELKEKERSLALAIEKDEVGQKIREIEKEIRHLQELRDERTQHMDNYNHLAKQLELTLDPDRETYEKDRKATTLQIEQLGEEAEALIRQAIELETEQKEAKAKKEEKLATIAELKKNRNNIPVNEARIRDMILEHTGATKEEIPFIGELVKVNDAEREWEAAIEKILHNLALHLIIPHRYYHEVNQLVNDTQLKGRITYFHYQDSASLASLDQFTEGENSLLDKIEILPDSEYEDWIRETIYRKYNYTCVESVEELERYREKAVTREGLIKFAHGRHEKDDRPQVVDRQNYVLGWDNQAKIDLLKEEIKSLQHRDEEILKELSGLTQRKEKVQQLAKASEALVNGFTEYQTMDWREYAIRLQEEERKKAELEENNDRIKALQKQRDETSNALKEISEVKLKGKMREIFNAENVIKDTDTNVKENEHKIASMRALLLSDFEQSYEELKDCTYEQLNSRYKEFTAKNDRERGSIGKKKQKMEQEATALISAFKHPSDYITEKFKDWRSDVNALPESVDMIEEYQDMLTHLQHENLPKYEREFNNYLEKTLTDKVGEFRMFFMQWKDSIDESIRMLNDSLKGIDYRNHPVTYIQLVKQNRANEEIKEFRRLMEEAMPNVQRMNATKDGRRIHFRDHIEPFMARLEDENWRNKVMDVRGWYNYKAEEFNRETGNKETTYENMGHLSGGEKAQLTYTILGSAIAYQFGIAQSGMQENSFRFIAIDEAFKAQDEDKARYLIELCRQLHLQLLVVTPNDNIHIVENDISYVYFVERKEEKTSWLYSMPIEQWKAEKAKK